ncbi:MAG TPA: DUF5989 family protein [Candidatus Saccharimonadales bacterium]|nr:DUF5989 family protein [Candidatus Saccharimonadales bacterium]
MKFLKSFFSRGSEANELMKFLWQVKLWFLIPFILILLIFGLVLVFAQASGVAPFIYTLI